MKQVTPSVKLIAYTRLDHSRLYEWLTEIAGYETASACIDRSVGSDSEVLVEMSARRCYKSYAAGLNPNLTKIREDSEEYHRNVIASGHGSVLEHATCTWAFENVSRVFTHELVRHRAGTAFSQESLRFVRLDELSFWVPPDITANPEAARIFSETVEFLERQQLRLAELFNINSLAFTEKKKLTSSFRRIAPEGLATGIVFTCNMRALRHVIEMRTSRHAEHEIRLVFDQVAEIATGMWPMLLADFATDLVDGVREWKPTKSKV